MALGSISMRKTREFLVSPLMESPESKAWEESIYIFQFCPLTSGATGNISVCDLVDMHMHFCRIYT